MIYFVTFVTFYDTVMAYYIISFFMAYYTMMFSMTYYITKKIL